MLDLCESYGVGIVDFGSVRKIGLSFNFKPRIKSLEWSFGSMSKGYLLIEVINPRLTEKIAKESLGKFFANSEVYPTETFTCSLSECAKALCDADKLAPEDPRVRLIAMALKSDVDDIFPKG